MDELEMIRFFVEAAPGPSVETRARGRSSLMDEIESKRSRRSRSIVRRTPGRLLSIPALAALLALLLVQGLLPDQNRQVSAAAPILQAASRTAALQPSHDLGPSEYAYTRSEGVYFDQQDRDGHVWGALVRTTREAWVALDGSGRIRQVGAAPVFPGPGDRARWVAAGSPPLSELTRAVTINLRFVRGGLAPPLAVDGFTRTELLRLAGDPGALAAAIRERAEKTDNPLSFEMLTIVGDILGESAAPPALRAALYLVASEIPRVELLGTVKDPAGRSGVAVAADRGEVRHVLIFEPRSSALLAQEDVLGTKVDWVDVPPGTPISYTVYLRSAIVRSERAIQ